MDNILFSRDPPTVVLLLCSKSLFRKRWVSYNTPFRKGTAFTLKNASPDLNVWAFDVSG